MFFKEKAKKKNLTTYRRKHYKERDKDNKKKCLENNFINFQHLLQIVGTKENK